MRRFLMLAAFLLLFGCLARPMPNSLHDFAKNAPADAEMVAFVNINRLLSSPGLISLLGLPEHLRYVGGAVTLVAPTLGTYSYASPGGSASVFGIEVFAIDWSSRLVPVAGWLDKAFLNNSVVGYRVLKVRGMRVESVKNVSYVVCSSRLYLATEEDGFGRLAEVWRGGANAQAAHGEMTRRLPEGDILFWRAGGQGETMRSMAISLTLRADNMTDAFIVADMGTSQGAEQFIAQTTGSSSGSGMTVHNAHAEDRYALVNATIDMGSLGFLFPNAGAGPPMPGPTPEMSVTPVPSRTPR